MKKTIVLIPMLLLFPLAAMAQVQADSIITDWFDKILQMIPTSPSAISGIALLVELLLRFVPTAQPLSILSYVSEFCKHLSDLLEAVSVFLNKVIGNRLASHSPVVPPVKAPYYNPPKFK